MKVLITVYNAIERDARVQRQIEALSAISDVDVLCCGEGVCQQVKYLQIEEGKDFKDISYHKYVNRYLSITKSKKYDVVYGNDYYSCLPMILSKKYSGTRYIYDAHELIIDCTGPRERFFKLMEKILIKRVDDVICASEQRSKIMKEYYRLSQAPYVIRNISKMTVGGADMKPEELKILEIPKTKIIYAGVLKRGRKLELLCKAAKELGNDYLFIIVGDGEQFEELQNICVATNITNVHFFGGKKSTELGDYIGKCDIGYLYYPCTDMNNKYCAPNKIYEYTSLGIPFVTNNNPTMEKEVSEYGVGAVFVEKESDNDTVMEIKKAIIKISNAIDSYRNNALVFSDNNDWKKEAEMLKRIIAKGN